MARARRWGLVLSGCALIGCDSDATQPPDDWPSGLGPITGSTSSGATTCGDGASGCDVGQFCAKPGGACGGEGVCQKAPPTCSGDCVGTCGCDGVYYCNACFAWQAGVDVDEAGDCPPPAPTYQALPLGGEPPRIALLETDTARDVCIRVVIIASGAPTSFDVTLPEPWAIESIVVTDRALDCTLGPRGLSRPQGHSVVPDAASGAIDMEAPQIPCSVGADLTLTVDASFAGPTESFQLTPITLELCQ